MIIGSTAAGIDSTIVSRPEIQTVDDLRGQTIAVTRLKALTDIAARAGLSAPGCAPTWTCRSSPPAARPSRWRPWRPAWSRGPASACRAARGAQARLPRADRRRRGWACPSWAPPSAPPSACSPSGPALAEGYLRALAQAVRPPEDRPRVRHPGRRQVHRDHRPRGTGRHRRLLPPALQDRPVPRAGWPSRPSSTPRRSPRRAPPAPPTSPTPASPTACAPAASSTASPSSAPRSL